MDNLSISHTMATLTRGERLTQFNHGPEQKELTPGERRKRENAQLGGMGAGCVLSLGTELSGTGTLIHEYAHKAAVEHCYTNAAATVQADAIDNIRNFLKEPSAAALGRILTGYDANNDGAAGVTQYNYGDGPSALGEKLGPNGSKAFIAAAGSVSTLIPDMAGFAAGFKLRKKHPLLGYSLMTMTAVHHFANSTYPLSAILGSKKPGHDWVAFARSTGIHPAITGAVFTLSLPAMGAAMYLWERRQQEHANDHEALSRLVAGGKIPVEKLDDLFEKCPGKEKIAGLEGEMERLIKSHEEDESREFRKEFRSLEKKLAREYRHFGDLVIQEFRDDVEAEKKNFPRQEPELFTKVIKDILTGIRDSYREDKVGTILEGAGLAGGLTLAGQSTLQAIEVVSPGTLPAESILGSKTTSVLTSVLGAVFAANAAYRAVKIVRNVQASAIDKVSAVSTAVFSGLAALGAAIPGAALPLSITGYLGIVGTSIGRIIAHKVAGD